MSDVRKGGPWGTGARAGAEWSPDEDAKLIAWGFACGYEFVADHDLDRDASEGAERIAWLRANKPRMIARIEDEAAREKLARKGK